MQSAIFQAGVLFTPKHWFCMGWNSATDASHEACTNNAELAQLTLILDQDRKTFITEDSSLLGSIVTEM